MKPENRTRNLMALLGWQGGTVHDACREIGIEPHDFLYSSADSSDIGPCAEFQRGYADAKQAIQNKAANQGALQYWLGAISAVQNNHERIA